MELWLGVENFVKIQSAKVCINQYAVLVGPNNSGKTFLMQLIQGMNKTWDSLLDGEPMEIILACRETPPQTADEKQNIHEVYRINAHTMELFTASINRRLREEKENIVRRIFGKEIPIGNLYIELIPDDHCDYLVDAVYTLEQLQKISFFLDSDVEEVLTRALSELPGSTMIYILSRHNRDTHQRQYVYARVSSGTDQAVSMNFFKMLLSFILRMDGLFLPASRTGLLMLYKEFFANQADRSMNYGIETSLMRKKELPNRDLTLPVYEFLRFLQTFSEYGNFTRRLEKELLFFERHVIEGHIDYGQHGNLTYSPRNEKENIPLFLASSMVNEVTPIELALISENCYRQLIIDEIEASLHPEKQTELVRFLNRIRKRGMSFILSTHSDTFVSRLNNLYVISANYPERISPDMLDRLGLEEADLIDVNDLYVYEFVRQSHGKSVVKQIKGDPEKGFAFDLFTETALKLFNEATLIEEGLNGGRDQI